MQCPTCNVALLLADRDGVEIDYCPQCRGVWLDRGELDKLIERAVARMGAGRAESPLRDERDLRRLDYGDRDREGAYGRRGDHDDDHDDDHGNYGASRNPGRKRSFLDDLFDIG
jgi:uncharacterized protein